MPPPPDNNDGSPGVQLQQRVRQEIRRRQEDYRGFHEQVADLRARIARLQAVLALGSQPGAFATEMRLTIDYLVSVDVLPSDMDAPR
jgi:hypothetical protein